MDCDYTELGTHLPWAIGGALVTEEGWVLPMCGAVQWDLLVAVLVCGRNKGLYRFTYV